MLRHIVEAERLGGELDLIGALGHCDIGVRDQPQKPVFCKDHLQLAG